MPIQLGFWWSHPLRLLYKHSQQRSLFSIKRRRKWFVLNRSLSLPSVKSPNLLSSKSKNFVAVCGTVFQKMAGSKGPHSWSEINKILVGGEVHLSQDLAMRSRRAMEWAFSSNSCSLNMLGKDAISGWTFFNNLLWTYESWQKAAPGRSLKTQRGPSFLDDFWWDILVRLLEKVRFSCWVASCRCSRSRGINRYFALQSGPSPINVFPTEIPKKLLELDLVSVCKRHLSVNFLCITFSGY